MASPVQQRFGFTPDSAGALLERADEDIEFLRLGTRPNYEEGGETVTIVDLFSGCGGMTLGLAHAAHRLGLAVKVPLAIDVDEDAIAVFEDNFPDARCQVDDVYTWFNGRLKARTTGAEVRAKDYVGGAVDVLVGGPPCQGNSDLNNHTRRDDPRNALYARMARAAFVLEPRFVLIENVPAVQHDKGKIVDTTVRELERSGYIVEQGVVDLARNGAPQYRRRHLVVASRESRVSPKAVLDALDVGCVDEPRTVHWAIGDLADLVPRSDFERASVPNDVNAARMKWLFNNNAYDLPDTERPACHRDRDHTYRSVYGRLRWHLPAQTITTGFTSMGQGRYVHPDRPRTITPREAARLQGFPDFFSFKAVSQRTAWARLIGNAVPPLLTLRLGELFFGPHRASGDQTRTCG